MIRPTWDEYFIMLAETVAIRSPDPKTQVGAILVKNNRIVSTGYNGAPAGFEGVDWSSNAKHQHVLHAELNAILYANRDDAHNSTLYVTHSPCQECAKIIAAAKVSNVKYKQVYKDGLGLTILKHFEIPTEQIPAPKPPKHTPHLRTLLRLLFRLSSPCSRP